MFFNVGEDATEGGTENVREVNGEDTDNPGEVDKNGGDDDFGEGRFDAVVGDADAGELGDDDDENENDKDDVGDAADVAPDLVDWGGEVGDKGFYG